MTAQSSPFLVRLPEAVLAGLAVLLLARTFSVCLRMVQTRRRHLPVDWYQTSPDPRGVQRQLRTDRVHLWTFGSWIGGSVERQEPVEQQPRRWRFRGRISGAQLSGFYWPVELHSQARSHGSFHLQMVDPDTWVGHYTTAVGTGYDSNAVLTELKDVPLEWTPQRPRRDGS